MAKPDVFSAQIVDAILAAVRQGAKQGMAANAAGVRRETLNRWLARGRKDPDSVYGSFAARYDEMVDAYARERLATRKEELRTAGALAS